MLDSSLHTVFPLQTDGALFTLASQSLNGECGICVHMQTCHVCMIQVITALAKKYFHIPVKTSSQHHEIVFTIFTFVSVQS